MRRTGKELASKANGQSAAAGRLLRSIVSTVHIQRDQVRIGLNAEGLRKHFDLPSLPEPAPVIVPASLKPTAEVMKLAPPSGQAAPLEVDRTLAKSILRGRAWWQQLCADAGLTVSQIAAREGLTKSYVTRIVRRAFLSPDILQAVLEGTAPVHLTTDRLTLGDILPASWDDQRRVFGITAQRH